MAFKKYFPLIIIFLIAFWVAWPLLRSGFIPTHDGEYHLIRFWQFDKNIRANVFLPRWAPDLNAGFGSPLFNFFYPLPNYLGELWYLLGFSFISSLKLVLASGVFLGALFFYFWAKEAWGIWPGVVGTAFYILAPYFLLDLYVRGSPGEVLALALFPAVLWSLKRKPVLAGFLLALLILAHNILALIFMPFLITYIWFLNKKKNFWIVFAGLALSCWFWLPALVESKYVTGLKLINFADHFPHFSQLILPSWGTGFSVPGLGDQMSFQIGFPHLLIVVLAVIFFRRRLRFWLVWFFILFFLLLEFSLPLWRLLPLASFIQYPWRFLSLIVLVSSFLAAGLASRLKSKVCLTVLLFLPLLFYNRYARPITYEPRSDAFYLNNPVWAAGSATLGGDFVPVWAAGQEWKKADQKLIVKQGKAVVNGFLVQAEMPSQFQINTFYFPGWQVLVDGRETAINYQNGLINFKTGAGRHLVETRFGETPIRELANQISLFSLLFLVAQSILRRHESRH